MKFSIFYKNIFNHVSCGQSNKILVNQDFSFSFYQDIKKVIILQLLKEYSCSQEVRQTLNIFILGLVVLLREWLENPDLESMEEYGKNFSCPHKTIFSSKSSII